jgi:hypothetical protein
LEEWDFGHTMKEKLETEKSTKLDETDRSVSKRKEIFRKSTKSHESTRNFPGVILKVESFRKWNNFHLCIEILDVIFLVCV